MWSQGSPSPQLVWQDGRSVCREEPERLRSLFALVFHRWVVEGAQCTGGRREPARQLLPAENCLHRGCSKQPHLFQVAGCHSWDFLLLEFDRFRTRGELGQGRLRADCYLALPDLQTAPPRDDRSDNLLAGFSRTQFCDSVDIAGL